MTDTLITESEDPIYDVAVFNQTIFAAQQTGLYRSQDNGENWENIYQSWMPDTVIPTLAVTLSPNFVQDKTVVAGVNGGIVLSTDNGETWVLHQFRNPIPMITSIAISPNFAADQTILAGTYEDSMFRSVNGGKTWQAFNFGLFDHNILCIAVSPNFVNDHTVYVGASSGIYRSINGGRLWHDIALPVNDAILSLALSHDGVLYAGTEMQGLFKSEDDNTTWLSIYETNGALNSILLLSDAQKIIIQVDDTIMISDDNGATWSIAVSEDVSAIVLTNEKLIVAGLADTSIHTVNFLNT
jgi:photosystem II stability/assembly factor-like uncharacterized protein